MHKTVFISYSHKDEAYKEALEEHLSLLKRNSLISTWHDRKITAGDEWKGQIDENLDDSDIVLLLTSSSFIASDYCFDVEMAKAIENHKLGRSIIIPIIVRSCDWKESPFSKFQAVPTDAKAVAKWGDADDAWLDVVEGIKSAIKKLGSSQDLVESQIEIDGQISISKKNEEWINDTEITLSHRKVSNVSLSDIYVAPDMKVEASGDRDEKIKIVESSKIISEAGRYLITGEDQQGKTSLLKYAYKEFLKEKRVPLYIDLTAVNKSDSKKLIIKALAEQYENLTYDNFMALSKKVLLLDNLDQMKLNMKYQDSFLEHINSSFTEVILTCHNSYYYVAIDLKQLREFSSAELVGFGHVRREEIVKKWVALGVEEEISDSDLYEQTSDLKGQLDLVIKKNIVPAKPVYILMLLQMFEAYSKQNLELTSYGHCYQQLIYQSFEKANIEGRDFEKYLNVITELSWALFKNKRGLNQLEIDSFFAEYTKEYLHVDQKLIIKQLLDHSIFVNRDDLLHFKYPYIYYFFVGKKIADNYMSDESIRDRMDEILHQLHREDYANIIIFITHHTKDAWILEKIDDVLCGLFNDNQPATLESDQLHYMREFIDSIPAIVVEQRGIEKERSKRNQNMDLLEQSKAEVEDGAGEPLDLLANINTTFKGMEVVGQIIRNRHASLKRGTLYSLAQTGASSGLRFLEYFINISESSQNEIIQLVSERVIDSPNVSDAELKQQAESLYMQLSFGVINAVIRKISSSIGSKEAKEIYVKLESENNSSAYKLLRIAIDLQFSGKLKPNEIEVAASEFKNNPVCMRILRELVVQHIYMFPIDYKAKQKISESLGISVKGQRIMDLKKIGKA